MNAITRFNRWVRSDHSYPDGTNPPERIDIVFNRNLVMCNSYGNVGVFVGDSLLFRAFRKGRGIEHNFRLSCKTGKFHSSDVKVHGKDVARLSVSYRTATVNDYYIDKNGNPVFRLQREGTKTFAGSDATAYYREESSPDGDSLWVHFRIRGPGRTEERLKHGEADWVETPPFDGYVTFDFVAKFKFAGHDLLEGSVEYDFRVDKYNDFRISFLPTIRQTED